MGSKVLIFKTHPKQYLPSRVAQRLDDDDKANLELGLTSLYNYLTFKTPPNQRGLT